MKYWLMKSEPDAYSIDDLKKDGSSHWDGVRNYQARNFMRDEMQLGDQILFYHSNCKPPGVVGLAEVCKTAHPDFTAWDPNSKYFDPKSSPDKPIWEMVDICYKECFPAVLSLQEMKEMPELEGMLLLRKGMRLSVQPVELKHFNLICKHARKKSPVV